jgi:hypothetical protein
MSTDKSSQPIDPLEILTRFNCAESDDLEFKSPRSGLPGSLRETYTAIANSQDDVILLGVGDDGKGGLAQEGVGRWTRYRLPECGTPHIRTVTPHI